MDWLFENLGKIITFVIFIVYILSSLKGAGKEVEDEDPAAADRARRIQEEIRRKILERQQQAQPEARREVAQDERLHEPEVWEREVEPRTMRQWEEPTPPPPVPTLDSRGWESSPIDFEEVEDSYAAQRREIDEKLQKAEELRAITRESLTDSGAVLGEIVNRRRTAPGSGVRRQVRQGLSGRSSLKAAVVLKEILDTPVGMR